MFDFIALKNNTGIILYTDYKTLKSFHEVMIEVHETSCLIKHKEAGFLMDIQYETRKACEGLRQVLQPPPCMPELGVRYGIEAYWPVLLVQCRMLRESLAYIGSTKRQQAITYALEDVIEAAINEVFGPNAKLVLERWNRIDPRDTTLEGKLDSRCIQFMRWSRTERKNNLPGLLASLDFMYPYFYLNRVNNGEVGLVSPDEYDALNGEVWETPKP